MKITVDVDCTPAEARQFFGLPDLQPMQAAVMADLEKRILKNLDTFSPDALLTSWMSSMPQNAERMWELFRTSIRGGVGQNAVGGTASKATKNPRGSGSERSQPSGFVLLAGA